MKITKRPIYEYQCQGPCGLKRKTLVAERAIDGFCTKCKRTMPDPNQDSLFSKQEYQNERN